VRDGWEGHLGDGEGALSYGRVGSLLAGPISDDPPLTTFSCGIFFSRLRRYLEASKTRVGTREAGPSRRVLVYVFDTCLRLLHPYMPFVTETLWQQLPTHPSHGDLRAYS